MNLQKAQIQDIHRKIKLNEPERTLLEEKLTDYLGSSHRALECFTDLDYFLAGADTVWNKAFSIIRKMTNYKLMTICERIDAEENGKVIYDSYYQIFNTNVASD